MPHSLELVDVRVGTPSVTRLMRRRPRMFARLLRSCTETITRGSRRMLSGFRRPSAVLN